MSGTIEAGDSHAAEAVTTADRPPQRVLLLRIVVAAACLAGMVLSPRLWLSRRVYPTTPVWGGLPAIPAAAGDVWFAVLLALLAAIVVRPRWRRAVVAFTVAAALLSFWDQSRWQPWFYQYLFMLAALSLPERTGAGEGRADSDRALDPCRIILAFTYFWSGLQKCNATFVHETAPWLFEPLARHLPAAGAHALGGLELLVPAVEAAVGLGMLFRHTRPIAVIAAITMHLVILWCLGPFGHRWNTVVWPWNLAMVACTVLLFYKPGALPVRRLLWPEGIFGKLVLLLFVVLPALSFCGWWDAYLSAALYSGNTLRGELRFNERVRRTLPPAVRDACAEAGLNWYTLDLMDWSIEELNVPPYPARRVFRNVAAGLSRAAGGADVLLIVQERPSFRDEHRSRTHYGYERGVPTEPPDADPEDAM